MICISEASRPCIMLTQLIPLIQTIQLIQLIPFSSHCTLLDLGIRFEHSTDKHIVKGVDKGHFWGEVPTPIYRRRRLPLNQTYRQSSLGMQRLLE